MHPPFEADMIRCHCNYYFGGGQKLSFWVNLEDHFPHCWNDYYLPYRTLILYTLCVGLPLLIPPNPQKRMFEAEPPAKRQCLPNTRKCGYCRDVGHSVRQCKSAGIEDYRAKTKAARDKKKNSTPVPVHMHASLGPPIHVTPTLQSLQGRIDPIRPVVLRTPPTPSPFVDLTRALVHQMVEIRDTARRERDAPAQPKARKSRAKTKIPPHNYPDLPKGQVRFNIENLLNLMPLPLVQRLKAGGTLTPVEIDSIWSKIPKKLDIEPATAQLNLGAGDLQITKVNSIYPNCPLGLEPLRWPVVGDNCTHRQTKFFNLNSLIQFWTDCGRAKEHVNNWNKCKICKQEFRPALLQRNTRYELMLAEMKRTEFSAYKANVVVVD